MNKAYHRINNGEGWKNYPSYETAVDEYNLNHMEVGIDEIDNRVVHLDTTKFDKTDAQGLIKSLTFNRSNGIFTITYFNGSTATIDTMLEKLAVNFDFDEDAQQLIIVLDDETEKRVDLSAFIKPIEFIDSGTIAWQLLDNGKVSAIVREGSIEEKHLRPDYLADIKLEAAKADASQKAAAESAQESSDSALLAKSYSEGDTGVRDGENTDNAKYYSEQAKNALESLEQSGTVTGVKGNAESAYRTGNVNVTPANIGALPSDGNAVSATKLVTSHSIFGKTFNGTQDVAGKGFFYGSYQSAASARYNNSALEIRENGLVGNSQSNSGYAPSIGFHWMNKAAGTLVMDSTGKFHLFSQDGVTPANLEVTATAANKAINDNNGRNIANTYETKAGNTWKKIKTIAYDGSATSGGNVHKELKIVAYRTVSNSAVVHGIYDFPISILDNVADNELYFGDVTGMDTFFSATLIGNSVVVYNGYKGITIELYGK